MNKPSIARKATVFCGIDVSAETLAVAVIEQDQPVQQREFANRAGGHKALISWLKKPKSAARVSMEATDIYSLDVALALDATEGIEVAVLNPKLVNRFAQTLLRSKTDSADAAVLAGENRRMSFSPLPPPPGRGRPLGGLNPPNQSPPLPHPRGANRPFAPAG